MGGVDIPLLLHMIIDRRGSHFIKGSTIIDGRGGHSQNEHQFCYVICWGRSRSIGFHSSDFLKCPTALPESLPDIMVRTSMHACYHVTPPPRRPPRRHQRWNTDFQELAKTCHFPYAIALENAAESGLWCIVHGRALNDYNIRAITVSFWAGGPPVGAQGWTMVFECLG